MQYKTDAIIYIGNYRFPMGDAVAKRALGLGKAFDFAGYKTLFIDEDPSVLSGSISQVKSYGEFEYCSIHHSANAIDHYLFRKDLKVIKRQILNWMEQYNIRAVILCGTKCAFLAYGIVSFVKKRNILIFADSMDWLTSHTGNKMFDVLKQLDTTVEIKIINKRVDGVICISKYLSDYYTKKGKKTIIIPPLSPYDRPKIVPLRKEEAKIVYAGVPCRLGRRLVNPSDAKDRLDLVIEILYELAKSGLEFEFIVYGMTKEDYDIVFPRHNQVTDFLVKEERVFFMGKQNEAIVKEAVTDADFTILLRENNRTSMAGFPTKVAESITLGTPVFTTDTSDIRKYLSDEVCRFVNLQNLSELKTELTKIILADVAERTRIKKLILKNDSFEPKKYTDLLVSFIKRCEK